ncbi:PKD domain-containing protein, partial [Candidatus Bipolaricaulota bacterium]|nr:PKD domain-containing protein [Candidatus Bipolaricaulota bacterium]
DDNVTANGIWIKNDGTAEWADIEKIVVKRTDTDTTLDTITTGTDLSNWQFFDGWAGTAWEIDDDGSGTIAIYYEVATGVTPGQTLRPVVKIRGRENGTDYEGDEVPYPDYVELQPPGLETVINRTPPSGGTAYSGQRLFAQKIECDDQDEDADKVRINPVQIKNSASTPVTPDEITKIEVCNLAGDILGETTDLTGINDPGGVTISTTQNNEIPDNGEMFLCLYVTFAGPEDVTAGHRLQLDTTVFFEEDGHTGSVLVSGDTWTLEINHRPTCDFDYTPSANLTHETEITFTAKDVHDQDGDSIAAHRWEFSDGGTGTGTSVKHTFAAGGSVWAKLTVEDARELTGSKTKTFDVEPPPVVPNAQFTWSPESPAVGEEVEFADTSTTPGGTTITGWD